jgi:hypothetical protein
LNKIGNGFSQAELDFAILDNRSINTEPEEKAHSSLPGVCLDTWRSQIGLEKVEDAYCGAVSPRKSITLQRLL